MLGTSGRAGGHSGRAEAQSGRARGESRRAEGHSGRAGNQSGCTEGWSGHADAHLDVLALSAECQVSFSECQSGVPMYATKSCVQLDVLCLISYQLCVQHQGCNQITCAILYSVHCCRRATGVR